MGTTSIVANLSAKLAALPLHTRVLLSLATAVFLIELALRRFAPKSAFYRNWTKVFLTIGHFWTAVLLAIVYFLTVSVISVLMKLFAADPLDRGLTPEPTLWRPHEPNPLGPEAAARHQF
jgi:ABC-type glycerol-3-phosphate transport system permease component